MSQPPPAHLRHGNAAGRHHGRQRQRSLVPYAAGAVLVHLHAVNLGQVQPVAAVRHGHGQSQRLLLGHLLEIDCHHQGGYLVIGNLPFGIALYEISYLLFGEFTAASLFHDDIIHPHILLPSCFALSSLHTLFPIQPHRPQQAAGRNLHIT